MVNRQRVKGKRRDGGREEERIIGAGRGRRQRRKVGRR